MSQKSPDTDKLKNINDELNKLSSKVKEAINKPIDQKETQLIHKLEVDSKQIGGADPQKIKAINEVVDDLKKLVHLLSDKGNLIYLATDLTYGNQFVDNLNTIIVSLKQYSKTDPSNQHGLSEVTKFVESFTNFIRSIKSPEDVITNQAFEDIKHISEESKLNETPKKVESSKPIQLTKKSGYDYDLDHDYSSSARYSSRSSGSRTGRRSQRDY
jgi:hypothetical protein